MANQNPSQPLRLVAVLAPVRRALTPAHPPGPGGAGPGVIRSGHPRGVVPGLDRTRGLASILFGLIAIEFLHAHRLTAAADFVAEVIVVTVGLSVLLRGLTAGIIAARWPAHLTNP